MCGVLPRSIGRLATVGALLAALPATPARGQTGFTPDGAAHQRALEARVVDAIRPAALERTVRALAARPHVAGSPAQMEVRDSLVAWFAAAGLEPEIAAYGVFLPWPTAVAVTLVAPETLAFALGEPPLPDDPATQAVQYPWVNGYSGVGVAEAPVVYANYGLHDDYAALDSLGVDPAGKVVVARYGRSFRGIKARLAEERGAVALLLYSDPLDDGYVRGDVLPDGPWRSWDGVQRGSVMTVSGDPTTPGRPSLPGVERVDPTRVAGVPRIPVVPVSYGVAAGILSRVEGADLPDQAWQGGLPFRYHAGPGPAVVRVAVEDDRNGPGGGLKPVHDVIAVLEGSQLPEEWIVVGAHVDAWGSGANDNASGTASVLEAARAVAALAAAGERPRRTIVFAGWDAEEWGLIGSTEWVEERADALVAHGIAYLNQDAVGGRDFGASASPSLKALVRDATRAVPVGAGMLLDAWAAADGAASPDSVPRMGNLGGGSDFGPFTGGLGIPAVNHGFGTPAWAGVYHSAHDTPRWMATWGDPGFENHARSSRLTAILALRLANAEVLPYDVAGLAREMAGHWSALRERAEAAGLLGPGVGDALDRAWAGLERAGERLARARDAYLASAPDPDSSARANEALVAVERALTRPEGLVGRPSIRNLAFAADARNGYATLPLPTIAEAVQAGDAARAAAEVADLARRVGAAAGHATRAAEALGG